MQITFFQANIKRIEHSTVKGIQVIPMNLDQKQIQHLYWRAGFGITRQELTTLNSQNSGTLVDSLFSAAEYAPLEVDISDFEVNVKELSQKKRKELRKKANATLLEMNLAWINNMSETPAVLRERMALFFHDHFAVRIKNPVANLHLVNLIRRNALGDFKLLLSEVLKSPAMILFLNNKQNKKSHPNENFAREVMELFTLGRDNGYTENDIQEAARAFTGWTVNNKGDFWFNERVHDSDEKTILGKTGNLNGDDVLEILLSQQQTANYITEKLLTYLLGIAPSKNDVAHYGSIFFESNYSLDALVRAILTSELFYEEKYIGQKIKSPTDLLVGLNRQVPVQFNAPKVVIQFQRKLNQVLFFPPNVAGWNHGQGWIDSSTLLLRMKIPSLILNFGLIEWDPDEELTEEMQSKMYAKELKHQEKTKKKVQAYPDWEACAIRFNNDLNTIDSLLLQAEPAQLDINDDDDLKTRVIKIMSTPEYQMC